MFSLLFLLALVISSRFHFHIRVHKTITSGCRPRTPCNALFSSAFFYFLIFLLVSCIRILQPFTLYVGATRVEICTKGMGRGLLVDFDPASSRNGRPPLMNSVLGD